MSQFILNCFPDFISDNGLLGCFAAVYLPIVCTLLLVAMVARLRS